MSNADETGIALYYPNFTPDMNWLKCSLLYWDGIRRIVPDAVSVEVRKKDPADCRRVVDEGLLRSTDPCNYRKEASNIFFRQLQPILRSTKKSHVSWLRSLQRDFSLGANTSLHGDKVDGWIHGEKASQAMIHDLQNVGLVRKKGEWLEMPNVVASLYMMCLASEMSGKIEVPLLTDQPTLGVGTEALLFLEPVRQDQAAAVRSLLLKLGIRFPRPQSLESVAMKTVLKFHQRNGAERKQLRIVVEDLLTKLAAVTDANHFKDVLESERRTVQQTHRDFKNSLKELGVSGFWSFLKISVPSMLVGATNMFQGIVDPRALAVAGISLGSAAAWAEFKGKRDKLISDTPWHYAWRVQRSFT